MGRKNKGKAATTTVGLEPEVASSIESKQKQGDEAFSGNKFGEALAAYDEALKALPERHALTAQLHASKASVYLQDKKWKECIKECNQGLGIEGNNSKVLRYRAEARFESGLYKDALSDVQKLNANADGKSDSVAELEGKVRTALAGKSASANGAAPVNGAGSAPASGGGGSSGGGGGGGSSAISEAQPAAAKKAQFSREQTAQMLRQQPSHFACKVTLEAETKYVHVPFGISYYGLQQLIRSRWTGLHNFKILYQDKDTEWVVLTSARDVQKAQSEILSYAHRAVNSRTGQAAQPPTCRFKLEKCARGDVPAPPKEEIPRGEETSRAVVKSADPHAEETVVELDEWLIEFANLFRDQLSIDPDKHVDIQTEGAEKCSRALDTVVQLPEARGLFDEAADRFRDVTCIGLCNWANVHLCLSKKLLESVAVGAKAWADVRGEFDDHCKQAITRYNEALGYHEGYVEAMLGNGQVVIEQARAEARLFVPPLDGVDSEAYKTMNQEELEELTKAQGKDSNAKLRTALEGVTPADVKRSAKLWAEVYDHFSKAEAAAAGEKSEKTAAREEGRADRVVSLPNLDATHLMANQVQIIWGNALYDQSQIWAGVGLDGWKAMVEDAKVRFLAATCKESDVVEAMRNHIQAQDLDLPPPEEPEVEAQSEKKPADKKVAAGGGSGDKAEGASAGGAKGLPALKKKKAKGVKA